MKIYLTPLNDETNEYLLGIFGERNYVINSDSCPRKGEYLEDCLIENVRWEIANSMSGKPTGLSAILILKKDNF